MKFFPGRFTFGITTGTSIQSLKDNLEGAFTSYAFPVGITGGFETEFTIPAFLSVKA